MLQTNFRRIVIARNMLEEELKFRVSVVDEDYEDGDNIFAPKKQISMNHTFLSSSNLSTR